MRKNVWKKWIIWFVLLMLLLSGCSVIAPAETDQLAPTQPFNPIQPTEKDSDRLVQNKLPEDSDFTVYFIDVGQADAALVVCDGKTLLIDGGNVADSNLIYTFLKNKGVSHLNYLIGTHAHEDHIGGLSGALNYAAADTMYCSTTSYNSNAFENFASNVKKQGNHITIPDVGTAFSLGNAECTVLAVNTTPDINNTSIVVKIVYGDTSFLFTGDAEREVEDAMMERGVDLQATVLKVGHHGSDSSTGYAFLRNVMPQYAVISCGQDNDYGHPHQEVLSRLRDADVKLFRTDLQGDIVCTSDGKTVSFSVGRNENENVSDDGSNEISANDVIAAYVCNTSSMKFHIPSCQWAAKISESNREEFSGSREELIRQGYAPCGSCHP